MPPPALSPSRARASSSTVADPQPLPGRAPRERGALTASFALAALRYWLIVFPVARRELRHWRRRARRIPDPGLRRIALQALEKQANMEGAAAFAVTATRRRVGVVVRALVAFQAAYNYADALAEQPSEHPTEHARRLHQALLAALEPDACEADSRAALTPASGEDRGYLAAIVDACRASLRRLPGYGPAAATARDAARRIVVFQSQSLAGPDALERWARAQLPCDADLRWWEAAAAAGSSLAVHALIAASSAPAPRAGDPTALAAAYFPWVGALHSLLDSLVDEDEDAATGQPSLIACYRSREEAAARMRWLTEQARSAARRLPHGSRHEALVIAMACSYLSYPEAGRPRAAAIAQSVREASGPLVVPALLIFSARRLAARARAVLARAGREQTAPATAVAREG